MDQFNSVPGSCDANPSRRTILRVAGAAATLAGLPTLVRSALASARPASAGWENAPMRWAHLVFADDDPGRYDPRMWLDFFGRAKIEGAVLSAGGFSAYYPTEVPFHVRSPLLGKHDMFGEMAQACHDELGIHVVARVDPHALWPEAVAAHPEWVMRNADGTARVHPADPTLRLACLNGGVAYQFLPAIMAEILTNYPVDAIFGNRWSGNGLCFCETCKTKFRTATGMDLPHDLVARQEQDEGVVQAYLAWDDDMRLGQLKLWNDQLRALKPWAFFSPGTFGRLSPEKLRESVKAAFADRQARGPQAPAYTNGMAAKEIRSVMLDKPIAGIFAVGQTATPYRFMDSTANLAELRAYIHDGLAQGFRPSVCKFKAESFDRRWMPVVERAFRWHARHETYFRNTANLATIALVQSVQTIARYDKAAPGLFGFSGGHRIHEQSYAGWSQALVESRIPFEIVDDRDLGPSFVDRFRVLVLADVAAMSEKQCQQIRDYVARGGRIIATNETSLYDERGKIRANFGLADLFGCDWAGKVDADVKNSYLALHGPHPLLVGLEDTPRIMNGTRIVRVTPSDVSPQPLTLIPSYPDLPMERVFPTSHDSGTPMVFLRKVGKGRVVYFANDIDRSFAELSAQDHLKIMVNAVDWCAESSRVLTVEGPGLLDVSLWRQANSVTAHLVNLTNPMAMQGSFREIIPVGPFVARVALPSGARVGKVRLLEADIPVEARRDGTDLVVHIPRIEMHEVIAINLI